VLLKELKKAYKVQLTSECYYGYGVPERNKQIIIAQQRSTTLYTARYYHKIPVSEPIGHGIPQKIKKRAPYAR